MDPPALSGVESSLYQKTLSCVHCGLCLPACPAYETLGRESVAPRGQVYNVRAMLEGRLALTRTLSQDIYDCLACRACESVCPAGVPVGPIMEEVRGLITAAGKENWWGRQLKRLILGGIVAHPRRLAWAVGLARLYQASGLRRLVVGTGLFERERLLPPLPPRGERRPLPQVLAPRGARRGRVGLFTGCIAAHFFAETNRATARVLQRNGFEVVVPRQQRCCGALHLHNGLPEVARRLARENLEAFRQASVEAVVVNAAGCGAALLEYGELLGREPEAAAFAERVVDISRFLVQQGFEPPPPGKPLRVAYDAPCHLFHAQGVRQEPKHLLESIPGVELVSYRDSDRCCGSAGIYNLTHYRQSMEILEVKMGHLAAVRPDLIVSGNPGCQMQLAHGVRRAGLKLEVLHPIVLLDRAYAGAEG
jgi:glycolate oxidase iron-sulfur subunit